MDDLMIRDFELFHKDRIQSTMSEVIKEYSLGKRIFNKYDIEDNWADFCDLSLDDIQFANSCIEVCFSRCSLKNSKFLNCNLKTIKFYECDLTNAYIDECSIESIDFENSVMVSVKLGTNYAYGVTLVNEY